MFIVARHGFDTLEEAIEFASKLEYDAEIKLDETNEVIFQMREQQIKNGKDFNEFKFTICRCEFCHQHSYGTVTKSKQW